MYTGQFFDADWKMKTAVRTPTNAVTANATVGRGDVRPKFCEWKKTDYSRTRRN